MSVGLYMDVHVPAAITRALVLRGADVLTAQLDGMTELDDPELLDRATALGFGGVIYAHQLGLTIGKAISDLEILAQAGSAEEFANRVEYLPL